MSMVDIDKLKVPDLFNANDIEEMKYSSSAITFIYDKIEVYFKTTFGIEFDSNMLIATSEFNLSNLEFLRKMFNFTNDIYAKLLNALILLLHLREDKPDEFNQTKQSKNIYSMHGSMSNFHNSKGLQKEIDFSIISKNKLYEFRAALIKLNLLKSDSFVDYKDKKNRDNVNIGFYLQPEEVSTILNYLNTFYFPFIRLYYHFLNIEQVTENKKIEIVIANPMHVPSLSEAVPQIQDRNQFDENEDIVESEDFSDASVDISINQDIPIKDKIIKKEYAIKDKESVYSKADKQSVYGDAENQMKKDVKVLVENKVDGMISEVDKVILMKERKIDDLMNQAEDLIKTKKK